MKCTQHFSLLSISEICDKNKKDREQMLVNSKRLNLVAIPEIAKIFSESCNISYENGRSHFIMRRASRKGKLVEMKNDMMVDQNINNKMQEFKTKIQVLEDKVAIHENRVVGFLRLKKNLLFFIKRALLIVMKMKNMTNTKLH